jgi:SP family general alpha glucoside:H+ symporter-like MFS transporter
MSGQVEQFEMANHDRVDITKVNARAEQEAIDEHHLTVIDAMRRYPLAIMWSILVSTAITMEGYDIVLISSFFGLPSFTKKYSRFVDDSSGYQISAAWQAGLSNGTSIGTLVGSLANGYFVYKFGYRRTLLVSLSLIVAFIFFSVFRANTLWYALGCVRNDGAGVRV